MPRPKIDRIARNVRLPAVLDGPFVARAQQDGLSIGAAFEEAVRCWVGLPTDAEREARAVAEMRAETPALGPRPASVRDVSFSLARPGLVDRRPSPKKGKQ